MSIINEQIQLILGELELIQDPYQRADIRTKLISCISEANLEVSVEEPVGKDAIKNDTKKEIDEPIKFERVEEPKEEAPVEETVEELAEEKEEVVEKPKKEEKAAKKKAITSKTKKGPKQIDLEPEKKFVTVETEDGETEVEITEAYNKIAPQMKEDGVDEEEIELTAQYLTCNALMPIYDSLEGLKDSYNKMMLAYYMQEYGVEAINESVISQISDGTVNDVYEFVNDANLEFTINSIEEAVEE